MGYNKTQGKTIAMPWGAFTFFGQATSKVDLL